MSEATLPSPAARRSLLATAVGAGALLAVAFAYSLHSSMPENVMRLPGGGGLWRVFWPQGWAFFTRDARTPNTLVYREAGGVWTEDDIGRSGDFQYALGFVRAPRARLLEVGFLASFASDAVRPCDESPAACLARAEPRPLSNPTDEPFLCGRVGLVYQDPLPWAWLDGKDETVMPSRVAVLDVSCP